MLPDIQRPQQARLDIQRLQLMLPDILLELLLAVTAHQQQHLVEAMPQQRRGLDLDILGHQLHRGIIQMLKHLHQGMTLQAEHLVLVMAAEK